MKVLSATSFAVSLLSSLFAHGTNAASETVLYSFCSQANCADGELPYAALIAAKGMLYGTAFKGGNEAGCSAGCGTVFSFNPNSGAETTPYTFCGQQDCMDGALPDGSLLYVKGTLYGTTSEGGTYGNGTVFSLDRKTRAETVIHSFGNAPDGGGPTANVIDVKGTLYGTTAFGGSDGYGTVFSLDPKTGTETVLYSFCGLQSCADGALPEAGLIDVKGTLYGTTGIGAPTAMVRYFRWT